MAIPCHQSQSGQTQFCGPDGPYVLTKVSRSGRRYFFNGTLTCVETANSGASMVAQTTVTPADAFQYGSSDLPAAIASLLNKQGIGGTPWCVAPFGQIHSGLGGLQ